MQFGNYGKCYYCGCDVIHENEKDFGAFNKKVDKITGKITLYNCWHMKCYVDTMNQYEKNLKEYTKPERINIEECII